MNEQDEFQLAKLRMQSLREKGYAVAAHYDHNRAEIVVQLNTGTEIVFPTQNTIGLTNAHPDDLAEIDISSAGLGLHWPRLDADLYVPGLIETYGK